MREGYDLDAVDDFVDVVIDALEGRSSGRGVTPEQIENEEFKVVRMREGYVMDDVDDWLDAAAAELRRMRKAAAQGPAHDHGAQHTSVGTHPGQMAGAPAAPPVAPPAVLPPGGYGAPGGYDVPASGYGAPNAAGYGGPAAPQTNPGYAPYYDTQHGAPAAYNSSPGTAPGTIPASQQTMPGAPPSYDPLTDSAVNELDPVLRALDPSFGSEQQYPQSSAPAQSPMGAPVVDDQSLSPSTTPSTGLHHVEVWVRDLEAATRSFGWLFERLGWTLFQAWEHGRSWQAPGGGPYVVVEASPDMSWVAYDRKAPGLNHLALAVPEQWMVDRIVSEAPAYGWHLMFADRHPHAGGPHHYAAYMENDEGFEVEVVAP